MSSRIDHRFERKPFFAAVTIEAAESAIEARTSHISQGGVGLICPAPLPVGEPVALTIRIPGRDGASERVSGRVASVRFDDDCAVLGVEFATVLGPAMAPMLARAMEAL